MEQTQTLAGMLELIPYPGFCVQNNRIEAVNRAGQALLFTPGMALEPLLYTGTEEYAAFSGGCLYLQLTHLGTTFGASVSRMGQQDLFVLDQQRESEALQAFALAAMELRQPLLSALISADKLSQTIDGSREPLARLNRGLHQLHRIINNMSDAGRCAVLSHQQTVNLRCCFDEIFEKLCSHTAQAGISLVYTGLQEDLYCLADRELLERAVLNLTSNALKFTPTGGTIHASLVRLGNRVQLCMQDSGSGIPETLLSSVYTRYLRAPGIEDSRQGLGLGLVIVRSAAAAHGGTVLIDQPEATGVRITMTMAIRHGSSTVRTPIDLPGGQDPALLELSDCLPVSFYEK